MEFLLQFILTCNKDMTCLIKPKDWINLLNIIFFSIAFTLTSEVNHLAIWKEY
jgi:hypothetical protein